MASKRQNGDPAESTTTAKKTKTDESEFTGTVFKSTLKDSTKALKGTLSVTYFSWLTLVICLPVMCCSFYVLFVNARFVYIVIFSKC